MQELPVVPLQPTEVEGPPASTISEIIPYWAARTPDAAALVEGARRLSYRDLDSAVRRTAEWLRKVEIRRGDRAMLVCENSCAAVVLYFACISVGAWPVIVNARLSAREIEEIRQHSGARRMIFTSEASLHARRHGENSGAGSADPAGCGAVMLGALNETSEQEPCAKDAANEIALLIYTSGTTGRPKGVMLSHRNLMFVACASAAARRISRDDRVLAILPVSHILGLTGVVLGSLVSGAEIHLVSRFDPAALLTSFGQDRLSVVIGTPPMYAMLAEYAARKQMGPVSAPALRLLSSAGAPLDAATKRAAESLFRQPLHNGYGITECSPTVTVTAPDRPRRDLSVGAPLPGVEIRLAGSSGRDAAQGEIGELWVRGPGVMRGYYQAPAETAEVITPDGWFRTGDLARMGDGNLFIVGRSKEMVIRFGFNIYPAEIEGVLNAHRAVARAAVIPAMRDGNEDIVAFVELRPGVACGTADLATYASAQLAPYKRPSEFIIIESLPLTPAGKVLKSALADMLEQRQASRPAA
ncbi:MAG TPA: class I adenylate-forming enzyme family protein [Rhizomicrobium sp.]|jgi:acyl-CoA synthetase (AMP-forming)/AMP-acid ligase II|nr:class I adenylate-forming enzyme family protein [Rhizomicrobium sp.]